MTQYNLSCSYSVICNIVAILSVSLSLSVLRACIASLHCLRLHDVDRARSPLQCRGGGRCPYPWVSLWGRTKSRQPLTLIWCLGNSQDISSLWEFYPTWGPRGMLNASILSFFHRAEWLIAKTTRLMVCSKICMIPTYDILMDVLKFDFVLFKFNIGQVDSTTTTILYFSIGAGGCKLNEIICKSIYWSFKTNVFMFMLSWYKPTSSRSVRCNIVGGSPFSSVT